MSVLGLYRPGSTVVHRAGAGTKLLLLLVVGAFATVLVDRPWEVAVALLTVVAAYAVARVRLQSLLRQLRPLVWLLLAVGGFHLIVTGWQQALVVVGVIAVLVLLAGLVTLTTPTQDLVDALVRVLSPLRRFGVDPDRVALLLALSLRSVPVILGLAEEVRDAQRARGLAASPRAFAVPLVIRALRHADRLGEALAARGIDD